MNVTARPAAPPESCWPPVDFLVGRLLGCNTGVPPFSKWPSLLERRVFAAGHVDVVVVVEVDGDGDVAVGDMSEAGATSHPCSASRGSTSTDVPSSSLP